MDWPVVEDLLGRTDLLDPAVVHDRYTIGQFDGFILVVSDEEARQAHLVVQLSQPKPQFLSHLGIERAKRLVEQYCADQRQARAQERRMVVHRKAVETTQPTDLHKA